MKHIHLYLNNGGIGDNCIVLAFACGLANKGYTVTFHTRYPKWFQNIIYPALIIAPHTNYPAPPTGVDDPVNCFFWHEEKNKGRDWFELGGMDRMTFYEDHIKYALNLNFNQMVEGYLPTPIPQFCTTPYDVVLSPIASHPDRTYPIQQWGYVIKLLLAQLPDIKIVVPVLKKDFKKVAQVFADYKANVRVTATFNESHIIAHLQHCKVFVGNDSGMAHIAALNNHKQIEKKPIIILNGAVPVKYVYGHYNTNIIEVSSHLLCTGCFFKKEFGHGSHCAGGCSALMQIAPGTIVEKIIQHL